MLRPLEFEGIRRGARVPKNQAKIDTLLYTGMRYVEAVRFHDNPGWFDPRGFVMLPPGASMKIEQRQKERWVKLNQLGIDAVRLFLQGKQLPTTQGFGMNLRKWAVDGGLSDVTGLTAKTFRKTWESWLVVSYPGKALEIVGNQGHTALTAIGHYLNMPFLAEEKEQMRPYVDGMF